MMYQKSWFLVDVATIPVFHPPEFYYCGQADSVDVPSSGEAVGGGGFRNITLFHSNYLFFYSNINS